MSGEFDFEAVSTQLGNDIFGTPDSVEIPDPVEIKPTELTQSASTGVVDPAAAEGEPEATEPAASTEDTSTTPAGAPKTWRKEALAAWETLPQVVKDEVAKREEDMFRGIETYKEKATIGDNFFRAVSPHMDYLQRSGVNPYDEINGLLEYGKIMRFGTPQEKMGLLSSIAQEYDIDLLDLAESAPSVPYTDPAIKALQAEVNALKSGRQEESSQRDIKIRAENQARIDAFAADPKHEHFATLEPEMAAFIQSGVCQTLEEAYEKALWANPLTRAKEQTRQATEAKAQSDARIKAAQAAKSANIQTNARPGSATAPKGSMDDTIAETLANIRSR